MTLIRCGKMIRTGSLDPGAAGCLINFSDSPERVLLMTAAHVLVPLNAKQNDIVEALDAPGVPFGRLRTWSRQVGATTVDAALVWVDPAMVSPEVAGLDRVPAGVNLNPQVGDTLYLYPSDGVSPPRVTKIASIGYTMNLYSSIWEKNLSYFGQIRCWPRAGGPGKSGAMLLDGNDHIVGMLVGGADAYGDLVTPIGAILNYPGWKGLPRVLRQIPAGAVAPPI